MERKVIAVLGEVYKLLTVATIATYTTAFIVYISYTH